MTDVRTESLNIPSTSFGQDRIKVDVFALEENASIDRRKCNSNELVEEVQTSILRDIEL